MRKSIVLLLSAISYLIACDNQNHKIQPVEKISENDYFKNTIIQSHFVEVDLSNGNAIKTQNGNLIIIPPESFIDENDSPVSGKINLEIAETKDPAEMLMSNATVPDGMVSKSVLFINATLNGKQLAVNPEHPVHYEITSEKETYLLKGKRDEEGEMIWKKKSEQVKYLFPVPLESLEFYPAGFREAVRQILPFRGHTQLSNSLLDSLFYSFAWQERYAYNVGFGGSLAMINLAFLLPNLPQDEVSVAVTEMGADTTAFVKGINPAAIKTLKNRRFENTLIATREFEERLQVIYKTCKQEILDLYVNNLHKNMWEIDEMAAEFLGADDQNYQTFKKFASLKQTQVKMDEQKAKILADFYMKEKKRNEDQIQRNWEKYTEKKKKTQTELEQINQDYDELVVEREKFRMNKCGFELTELGWFNFATKQNITMLKTFQLNITIENGELFDRDYVYVINPEIESLFALKSDDKVIFNKTLELDPYLLLKSSQDFTVVGVGFTGDSIYYSIAQMQEHPVMNVKLQLQSSEPKTFKKEMKMLTHRYLKPNSILVDLEYQRQSYDALRNLEAYKKDYEIRWALYGYVFPCN
ncbi:MAG: hypothetical protein KDC09_05990 [Bacteroidales bacterium]|nr:hypothetical protein [Bacteroidales bacterium]